MASVSSINDQLVTALYGAVDDKRRWVMLMDLLRDHLGVESAAAQLLANASGNLQQVWMTRDRVSERHAVLHDSWANSPANPRFRPVAGPGAQDSIGSDLRNPDLSAQDCRVLRQGLARCGLGSAFWIDHRLDDRRGFTMIFHRRPDDWRDVDGRDRAVLQAFAPHVQQAVRLWTRLADAEAKAGCAEQGDSTGAALITCDRHLAVHWMNAGARALLASGAVLRMHDRTLACAGRADQDQLRALVEGRSRRAVLALGEDGGALMHVRAQPVVPGPGQLALHGDLITLMVTRPAGARHYDEQDISALFGLTPTEAALAASLANGASVCEFARARGVAEGTARMHLKRILAKTGTGRQSELVRQICRSVA